MSYQEEERSRLRRQSTDQAVGLAIQGKWKEAVAVNRRIVELFPNDVEALNRLGRAHLELGDYAEAEAAYGRTAELDSYNAIAQKNLQRLARLRESTGTADTAEKLEPQSFIEEVGKAGVVQIEELAPPEIVARTAAGDRVQLRAEPSGLIVETGRGEYLGMVHSGHAQRLMRLMDGGNRYSAAIVSAGDSGLSVIIREEYQDPSQAGRPSFPARGPTAVRLDLGERAIRREREVEGAGDPGYTVVGGGEEAGILVDDTHRGEDDGSEEE